jgi:hypothetical protein
MSPVNEEVDMDPVWDATIERCIDREGRNLELHPGDQGGATKYGISSAAHPEVDIANLTLDQAKQIYFDEYVKPNNLDLMVNKNLAERLFDMSVLSGAGAMAAFVHQAMYVWGLSPASTSRLTLSDIRQLDALPPESVLLFSRLLNVFQGTSFLIGFIGAKRAISEMMTNPHRRPFIKGWMRRLWEVQRE